VAKDSLQLDLAGQSHHLANDSKGHTRLLQLLRAQAAAQVVCEASGGYEQAVVRALHAAAVPVSVVRCDPILKAFYMKLRAAGKEPKVVLVVCMRKLVVLMNRLLKNPNLQLAN
jgi:transposase